MALKFISWNVNGLRAIVSKGFENIFKQFDADFVCLQEIKLQQGQLDIEFEGYQAYYNYAERKGYSGTAIFTRHTPDKVTTGIGIERHDKEGRVLTLEYPDFFLVNVYTPNSQSELVRLDYRLDWEESFREYLCALAAKKHVVVCGDLNVAHTEIDLANPKTNRNNPGFTDQERQAMTQLLDAGFIDTFRHLNPDLTGAYSWWSYRGAARQKNVGWRIDYFLTSKSLAQNIASAAILSQITGSDHCPVEVQLDI